MYIRPLSNANAPVAAPKSGILDRAAPGLADFTQHQLAPIASGLQQWGFLRSGEAKISQVSTPWDNWASERESARLFIFGNEIPDGAVLTHCDVSDDVTYSAIPTSNLNPVALGLMLSVNLGTQIIDGKKVTVGKNATVEAVKLNGISSDPEVREATAIGMGFIQKDATLGATQSALDNDEKIKAYLASGAYTAGSNRLRSQLNKVYIGDKIPKRAELRLVLHDVLAQAGDRMMLVQSRHSVLANLHSMFCKNPGGLKLLGALSEQTLRSVASRISATNLAGRLVQLSSKGLDLYQVKTWVASSFVHKEVPDSNVIAVRVSLVEFESLYSILEDEGPIQGPLPSAGSKTPIAAPAPDSFSRPGIAVGGDESAFRRF